MITRPMAALVASLLLGGSAVACTPSGGSARDATAGATRVVVDMRGTHVTVPRTITRVATIDDGFVEGVMSRFGVMRTLVAVGSTGQQRVYSYTYPSTTGTSLSVSNGMGTMRVLHPWIAELPCASLGSGDAINYEALAATRPEVVIARAGDCTLGVEPETLTKVAAVLASLRIPLVVLRSPTDYRGQGLDTLHAEIAVLGQLFGRQDEAAALAGALTAAEASVQSRLVELADARRPRVLMLGLASGARSSGGAAYVWGVDTAESWMLEHLVGARNAFRGTGARVLINAEQILSLDPDVIFLPTSAGYHPPEELAHAPYFAHLRRLRAVREQRVYALPWTPMNCARRLEYPIDLLIMAKGTYPDRFRDVAVHAWTLDFYRRIYGVDEPRARALLRAQWLDWTVATGF